MLAAEVLVATSGIRNMIREGKTHQISTALQTGHQYGMQSMDESLAELYKRGLISYEMALTQSVEPGVLKTLLGRVQ